MADKDSESEQKVAGFEDLFVQILENSDGDDLAINDVIDAFGYRAFGPLILVPALLAALPTGVIPGVPILLGAMILLVSGQILIGRKAPWIPRRLRETAVNREVLKKVFDRFRPYLRKVDTLIKPRLTFLADPPVLYVLAILCILLAITMVPLELIPFAVAVPATGVIAFGLGIATRDGLVILLGLGLCVATVWVLTLIL